MVINFCVENQRLFCVSDTYSVERSQHYILCNFAFSSDWDGLTKAALFLDSSADNPTAVYIDDDGNCNVPSQITCGSGNFSVSVIGTTADNIENISSPELVITSSICHMSMLPTIHSDNIIDDEDAENTFAKFLQKIKAIEKSVKDTAESMGKDFDNKFVAKVPGKGLSANDYTNEEKEKLINLPTKTELDSDLEGKQDKLVFDSEPTYNSDNSVTSGVIYSALENITHSVSDSMNEIGSDIGAIQSSLDDKVDKVDGKGLSANDYTDEDAAKLSALPTKSELNSDLGSKQDKLTFDTTPTANSTNPVTSGGVANAVENLNVQIGAQLETVLPLKADKTELADLKLKSVPHKDVSGYPVTFADHLADEEFIKCNVYGCKNLIPYPYADATKTENGVTFTDNGDGSITVNGTATKNTFFGLKYHLTLPKGKFYFSGCPKNGSTSTYYIAADVYKNKTWQKAYSNIGNGVSVNTENLDYDEMTLSIVIVGNYTADNLVFKPQIELGTSATSFEVNKKIGTLDSTDGKYKIPVTLTGKNVLPYPYKDPSKTGNGISFTVNGDRSVSLTGTATGKATYYFARSFELKSGTYTLSEKMKNQSSNVSIILDAYAGGTFLSSHSASAKKTTVITLSQDVTVSIYAYVPTGVVCENYPVKPQLEYGTAETEYEPYTTNSVTAALDTALGEGEYIDIINKKRYGTDGSTTDITVSGSLKTIDSAKNHISCGTTETPSKIELSYWQDINKVLSETTNAILAQGGDV